jgi:hypothetical protein
MRLSKLYVVFLFLLATLVPTELLHYAHVVDDLKEHYKHHQELSISEFISHALTERGADKSHPEHNHSPFSKHHSVCATTFVSVLPEQGKIIQETYDFSIEKQEKGVGTITHSLQDVYLSIWQPPKL